MTVEEARGPGSSGHCEGGQATAKIQEQRRVPRVTIPGRVTARVRPDLEVRLLDLSTLGARIEHLTVLHPRLHCVLELPPPLGALPLSAEVVWSNVIGGEQTLEGERHLRYQTGLVFVDVTAEQQAVLSRILERLTTGDTSGQSQLTP